MADPCGKCGQVHKTGMAYQRPCKGHKRGYRNAEGVRILYPQDEQPPCTQPAMRGQDVCHAHGGAAKQNRAAGEARVTEEKAAKIMARFAGPIDTTPSEALLDSIRWTNGYVVFLRQQVERTVNDAEDTDDLIWGKTKSVEGDVVVGDGASAALEKATTTTHEATATAWDALLREWQKELTKLCTEAIKIGIEERRVRLAESQGAMVADAIQRIFDAILQVLTAAGMSEQLVAVFQAALATEAPRHLRLLAG